jgi:hypothetical protein
VRKEGLRQTGGLLISRVEEIYWCMAGGGCENKGFLIAELDAMRFAEFVKSKHIVSEVQVLKELVGVLMVREAIRAMMVGISAISNVLIDAH